MTPSVPEKEIPGRASAEDEEVDNDESIWVQQGYTPLISGNGLVAHGTTMGPMTSGFGCNEDDDDWSEDDVVDTTQTAEGGGVEMNAGNNVQGDLDFRSLADQALSQLEQDYFETVRATQQQQRQQQPKETDLHSNEQRMPLFDDNSGFADWGAVDFEDSPNTQSNKDQVASAAKPQAEIDSDAVRKAVSKLQLQQPSGFSEKYKEWGEKAESTGGKARYLLPPDSSDGLWTATMIVPHHHPLIDSRTLSTYARRSRKLDKTGLEDETHRLSRATTLSEAIYRLDLLQRQDKLVIHLIGCDHEEQDKQGQAPSLSLPGFLKPAVSWLATARQVPPALEFHLIGPNLQTEKCKDIVVAGTALPSPLRSVTVQYHSSLYHDYLKSIENDDSTPNVDIIISYHAGIWGYDSWTPTLEYLSSTSKSRNKKIPFVITAYTLWECQEDFAVMEDFQADFALVWKPQISPFGSHKLRPTATAPSAQKESYRENAAWQAWKV